MILYAYNRGYTGKYYDIQPGIYHLDTIDYNGATNKIRLEIYNLEGEKALKTAKYNTILEKGDTITNEIIKNIPENWVEKAEEEEEEIEQ